ncbi:MAG: 5-amino-6-(D-ribitylamino)uracil--L-tyrosine 4-hydroxyphenyl transferase CofH [Pseudomonadota bacterium]
MSVEVVIAVRGGPRAKSRCAALVEGEALAAAMLRDMVGAALRCADVAHVHVVTPTPDIAADLPVRLIVEPEAAGVNAAFERACRLFPSGTTLILLPGDLPQLRPEDITALVAAHVPGGVTVVPSATDAGTGAIVVGAGHPMQFSFGPGSFARHMAAPGAQRFDSVSIGDDLDRPEDAVRAMRLGGPHSRACLAAAHRLKQDPDMAELTTHLLETPLPALMREAAALRDAGQPLLLTYSRKLFVPLTQLCRDVCHYCTFATAPSNLAAAYMAPDDVLALAHEGARAGCAEVLFTLGDKPELRYAAAREGLATLGHATTVDYLAEIAGRVLNETGLLPHINAGVLTEADYARLRPVAGSMGLMLETTAARLGAKGGPHHGSPDKDPAVRLASIDAAGRAKIPFTTGLLIGIGETRAERIEALLAIRELHARHGHIQEVIIQNFRAKPGTKMATAPEPDLDELLWTLAAARLIMGPDVGVQSPPNLNPGRTAALIGAGLSDWGGISPITIDHVNPEAPWPEIAQLSAECAREGRVLAERLTVYPAYLRAGTEWLDPAVRGAAIQLADGEALARADVWSPGLDQPAPGTPANPLGQQAPASFVRRAVDDALARAVSGDSLHPEGIAALLTARGAEAEEVVRAADQLRRETSGDNVTYVVNRNINYTNICTFSCSFCAFSKTSAKAGLRDKPYVLAMDELATRVTEAWDRGATEVCLQGGIHPAYTGDTYREILRTVKQAQPAMHVHAFSPLEVAQGAATLGMTVPDYLALLRDEGLGSLPGTAAEILADEVRTVLCPDKLSEAGWLDVVRAAHRAGLPTTATIMFGHVETPLHQARHLAAIRALQLETGGFTEFVPLPFVHMQSPVFLRGQARKGPTWREVVLLHAAARIALHGAIGSIQASWVKLGLDGAAACLNAGVNDLGGVLMNESISRAAGAAHGQETTVADLAAAAASAGRPLQRRTTLYAPAVERAPA